MYFIILILTLSYKQSAIDSMIYYIILYLLYHNGDCIQKDTSLGMSSNHHHDKLSAKLYKTPTNYR